MQKISKSDLRVGNWSGGSKITIVYTVRLCTFGGEINIHKLM